MKYSIGVALSLWIKTIMIKDQLDSSAILKLSLKMNQNRNNIKDYINSNNLLGKT